MVTAGNHTLRIESPGFQTLVESLPVTGSGVITINRILVPVPAITTATMVSPTTNVPVSSLSLVTSATATPTIPLSAGIGMLATAGEALIRPPGEEMGGYRPGDEEILRVPVDPDAEHEIRGSPPEIRLT